MKKIILTVAIIALLAIPAIAKKGEFRDRNNNLVGTSERHGDRTEYRDRHNNLTGTSERRGDRIEYRDRHNNLVGEERLED
jgi:Ni/Co efflux regulator RcnB